MSDPTDNKMPQGTTSGPDAAAPEKKDADKAASEGGFVGKLDFNLSDEGPDWLADPAPTSDKPEGEPPPEDSDLPPAPDADMIGPAMDAKTARRRNLLWYALAVLILLAAVGAGGAFALYLHMARDLPRLDALSSYKPYLSVEVLDRNNKVIWEFWKERRKLVPYEKIPKVVVNAFQAAEDASFFEHGGIDPWAIARAAVKNFVSGGKKQGASTITQQVAKTFLLSNEKTYSRKAKEAILAYRIESNFTKQEILYLYLNQIFLGNGAYGVKAAAESYFHKDLDELSIAEAALLAALPKKPTELNPVLHYEAAIDRQRYVLGQMLEHDMITKDEFKAATAENVTVYPQAKFHSDFPHLSYAMEEVRLDLINRMGEETLYTSGVRVKTTLDDQLQRYAYESLRRGLEHADKLSGWRGPLRKAEKDGLKAALEEVAKTNGLDETDAKVEKGARYEAVVLALGTVKRVTARSAKDKGAPGEKAALVGLSPNITGVIPLSGMDWASAYVAARGPAGKKITDPAQALSVGSVVMANVLDTEEATLDFAKLPDDTPTPLWQLSLEQDPEMQAGMVVLDPFTGDIRAMIGGYSFEKSSFNRVTQALRQPGSSFKPLIYSIAIENGYTQMTKVFDTAVVLPGARQEELWMPKNHDDEFRGEITLRKALALSINTIAVKLVLDDKVGVSRAREFVTGLGMQSEMPKDFTIALGSAPVTLLEMARAFSMFPNGGHKVKERLVIEGDGPDGEPLFSQPQTHFQKPGPNGEPPEDQAISPQTAYIMTSMLGAVITEGTGARAATYGRPAGGKTGTSSDSRDAWFIGFNPKLVCAVWFGFDDNRSLGGNASGGLLAAPTWLDFMQQATPAGDPEPFPMPDDIVMARMDTKNVRRIPDPVVDEFYSTGGNGPVPKEKLEGVKRPSEGILLPFRRGTEPPLPEAGSTGAGDGPSSLYEELEPGAEPVPAEVPKETVPAEIPKD